MGRRKGEITTSQKNRTHPWQVEIDSGQRPWVTDAMERWAAPFNHERIGGQRTYTWCFCAPDVADDFAEIFGGRRIDHPVYLASVMVDDPGPAELARRERAARFGIEIMENARAPLPAYLLDLFARIEAKKR